MLLNQSNNYNLYKGLNYNFLYNKDINSIHILLNLYDLEINIRNIYPKYLSLKNLRRSISRILKGKSGRALISKNLSDLIHEDVNRLELFLYLEGYKLGYQDNKKANLLERLLVNSCKISELDNLKYVLQLDSNEKIVKFKNQLYVDLDQDNNEIHAINEEVSKYCTNLINPKILSLNKHIDKQLIMRYDSENIMITEDTPLIIKDDLIDIYNAVYKVIMKNSKRLLREAYWNGIKDKILKRYK